MLRLTKNLTRPLSVRLSLMIVSAMAVLLMASLAVMLYYSRKVIKDETLQKASQTLETTVQHMDNILLSVEQAAGNMYFNILFNLDHPEMMDTYCRELVAANPYITGCAIAFKPGFYKGHDLFMPYYHRTGDDVPASANSIVKAETFGETPYTTQVWYTEPMKSGRPFWLNPAKGMKEEVEPLNTFCLPIYDAEGHCVAILGVDVSLNLLSRIILETKPSANSYCTLLDSDGSYLVHPDSRKLRYEKGVYQTAEGADPSVMEAGRAMVSGETGYKPFFMNGAHYYVFYKPFNRVAISGRYLTDLGWSAGIIYPEEDIFGEYNRLIYYVFAIAIVGILLLFVLSKAIFHRQLLPLRQLTRAAGRIADGHYDEPIPETRQQDEIGRLQENFQQMQTALAKHRVELQELLKTLKNQNESLHMAYDKAKKADSVKVAFLHHMTNQMVSPSQAICMDVDALCHLDNSSEHEKAVRLADDIAEKGKTITGLLNDVLKTSQEVDETGKEVSDEH